ncbi:meckelin-like, partial [Oppia nitens]|uniref:meckelin-like n=1 Tax=Oppia nitens TaxID=1686743 RepID=UPI0023DA5904
MISMDQMNKSMASQSVNQSVVHLIDNPMGKLDLFITISVLCYAALLWSIFRTWCFAKRNGKTAIDLMIIIDFIMNTIAVIANVFFIANALVAVYIFMMFKKKTMIRLNKDQEYSLIIYIIVAFVMKSIHLLYKLITISTVNIFFIDWERPKNQEKSSLVTITHPKHLANDSPIDDKLMTNSGQIRRNSGHRLSISGSLGSPTSKADKPLIEFPNVTVWRTNFVANEWMELCGRRRLSLSVHILLVILVFDWFGLANVAICESDNTITIEKSDEYVPQVTTCRLAIGTLVTTILALINIVIKKLVYENLMHNELHQFVDLCSVCNISVFVMLYKRFGYYIHGLAANGKSDVNMVEMYELLEREENDLCSKRGLLPNSDHQTFEMSLPLAIDEHYRRIRSNLSGFIKITDRMRSFGSQTSKIDIQKLIPTYVLINKFLSGFIEHNFKDVDYIVREKSTFESILDAEFGDTRDKGNFYSDNGHSFEAVLYYGLESTLICFEILLFLVSDMCYHNFTFSAIFTF